MDAGLDVTQSAIDPELYARWRASRLGAITERVETDAVFGVAGRLDGKQVLDVGTGDGHYAIEAAARGASVTGVDRDDAMLDAARTRALARAVRVNWQQCHAEALPFEDDRFEVVFGVALLCLVRDPAVVVGELARVLVPGGRVVLGELSRFSVWAAERRVRGWLGARTWTRARFWSSRELSRLLVSAGLRVVAVRGAVHFPPLELAARAIAPLDGVLARLRAPGGAFLAIAADKPAGKG